MRRFRPVHGLLLVVALVAGVLATERWLSKNVPAKTKIYVDERLGMDTRKLARRYDVDLLDADRRKRKPSLKKGTVVVLAADRMRAGMWDDGKKLARFGNNDLYRTGDALLGDPRIQILGF